MLNFSISLPKRSRSISVLKAESSIGFLLVRIYSRNTESAPAAVAVCHYLVEKQHIADLLVEREEKHTFVNPQSLIKRIAAKRLDAHHSNKISTDVTLQDARIS